MGEIDDYGGQGRAPCIYVGGDADAGGEPVRGAERGVRAESGGVRATAGSEAKGDGDNEISLAFPNGSRIVGLLGTETTVRGFSAVSLLLVDEVARGRRWEQAERARGVGE